MPGRAPPKQEARGQRETSVPRGAEAARTSFVLKGSPPQPVVVRAVAAVLAGGREGGAVPQPQLDSGYSLHFGSEGAAAAAPAVPVRVPAVPLPKLCLQSIVDAWIWAAGTLFAAVRASTVAPL